MLLGCFAAGGFHVKQLDVTDDTSVHKCISDTIKDHGRLDCLINNAGFGTQQNVEQACVSFASWQPFTLPCMTAMYNKATWQLWFKVR